MNKISFNLSRAWILIQKILNNWGNSNKGECVKLFTLNQWFSTSMPCAHFRDAVVLAKSAPQASFTARPGSAASGVLCTPICFGFSYKPKIDRYVPSYLSLSLSIPSPRIKICISTCPMCFCFYEIPCRVEPGRAAARAGNPACFRLIRLL